MKVSTTTKVSGVLSFAIALIAGIGVVTYLSTDHLVESRAEVERAYEVLMRLESVMAMLIGAEAAQRGYVITGDSAYLAPYHVAAEQLDRDIDSLATLVTDPMQLLRIGLIGEQSHRRLDLSSQIIGVRNDAGFEAATALVRSGDGRQLMDGIRATAADVRSHEMAMLERRIVAARRTAWQTKGIAATSALIALFVVAATGFFVARDLRRRLGMERAARESEALLNQFMECLPAGAYVVDPTGRPRYANALARAMFGDSVRLDNGTMLPHSQLMHHSPSGEPYRVAELPIARALAGHAVRASDIEIRRTGDTIPLRVSAAPIFDSDGEVSFAIAVFTDVSEEKRNEARLRGAKELAEHANRTKSEFLARMSHELRTPLNSVIGFSNILRKNRSGNLSAQELGYLERISENGRNLLALINDVLDLSKIESGKVEVERHAVDLRALIDEMIEQLRPLLQDRKVVLTTEIPAGLEPLQADAGRLRQVLLNLVGNALKFTASGTVRVVVDTAEDGRTPARVRVIDSGIGVPADRQAAIFEAFEQVDSGTSRSYGGTGLGLPISRTLSELMGFTLTMTSRPGTGSEFAVGLGPDPVMAAVVAAAAIAEASAAEQAPAGFAATDGAAAPPAAAAVGEEAAGHAPASRWPAEGPLVLIVDDEEDSRILLTHLFEETGCRVLSTGSGTEALEIARGALPDLITLDLLMPELSGWDVLSSIKADPRLEHIPTVVVSVVAEDNRTTLADAVEVLSKPLRRKELENVLRRSLPAAVAETAA